MSASRRSVIRLMNLVSSSCRCPAHMNSAGIGPHSSCQASTQPKSYEYALQVNLPSIRFGAGVTRELGKDFQNYKVKNVCVVTDANVIKLPAFTESIASLEENGISYTVYDKTRIEPTESSFRDAIEFAKERNFDSFLAVGGGSCMDTAKAANLYLSCPEHDFLDFVNIPFGKGLAVPRTLKPLIAVPTTSGTGSETTAVAVFDYEAKKAKTGIVSPRLRPSLGIVDPLHTRSMPKSVAANTGFDLLCHALESYTCVPYKEREPRPANPSQRPSFQGRNPISDVWVKQALIRSAKYLKRSVLDPEDMEARSEMHMACTVCGLGFGNAGIHIPHGLSYVIAGMNKDYIPKEYNVNHRLVPHGLAVVLTAPAVFRFTAPACPERHLEAAGWLGADIANKKTEDGGRILADVLLEYMSELGVDDGLSALGFTHDDIPTMVQESYQQNRALKLSPKGSPGEEEIARIYEESMKLY